MNQGTYVPVVVFPISSTCSMRRFCSEADCSKPSKDLEEENAATRLYAFLMERSATETAEGPDVQPGPSPIVLSTSEVDGTEAIAYWRDLICATFVEVAVQPSDRHDFNGHIAQTNIDGLALTRLSSHAQQVCRSRRFITRSQTHYLLANIQLHGQGRLEQDDRRACSNRGP